MWNGTIWISISILNTKSHRIFFVASKRLQRCEILYQNLVLIIIIKKSLINAHSQQECTGKKSIKIMDKLWQLPSASHRIFFNWHIKHLVFFKFFFVAFFFVKFLYIHTIFGICIRTSTDLFRVLQFFFLSHFVK